MTVEPIYKIKGVAQDLAVYEDKVEIKPRGIFGASVHGLKGTKSIFYRSITALQYKRPAMTSGYLQFTLHGGTESKGGVFAAASDENTFMFANKKEAEKVILAKEFIEKRINEIHTPTQSQSSSAKISPAEEITKLARLKEAGLITDGEFVTAKSKILSSF